MQHSNSAQNNSIVLDEQIRDVLRRHIKRAYDRHLFTRATLSSESGVPLAQIDQIVAGAGSERHRRVRCEDAFNIAYTLGDGCVQALIGLIRYTAQKIDGEALDASQIMATTMPHMATIATAAADGRFDHTEMPSVRDAADQIIATFLPFSSAGGVR